MNFDEKSLVDQLKSIQSLDRATFLELYSDYLDHSYQFLKLRTTLYVEFSIRPESGQEERKMVQAILDGQWNLQEFIIKNMQKDDRFFVVNKRFWDQWNQYSKSKSKKAFYFLTMNRN